MTHLEVSATDRSALPDDRDVGVVLAPIVRISRGDPHRIDEVRPEDGARGGLEVDGRGRHGNRRDLGDGGRLGGCLNDQTSGEQPRGDGGQDGESAHPVIVAYVSNFTAA
jgi:hypothetical protein